MDCIIDLKQVVGIIMVFSVPLSLIIGLVYYLVDMKRNAFRLRSEIISGGVDCDTARLLLEETGRRHSLSFATLRLGLLLFFTGIAAVLARVADFTILTLWLRLAHRLRHRVEDGREEVGVSPRHNGYKHQSRAAGSCPGFFYFLCRRGDVLSSCAGVLSFCADVFCSRAGVGLSISAAHSSQLSGDVFIYHFVV